jgi:hypothetical protein
LEDQLTSQGGKDRPVMSAVRHRNVRRFVKGPREATFRDGTCPARATGLSPGWRLV